MRLSEHCRIDVLFSRDRVDQVLLGNQMRLAIRRPCSGLANANDLLHSLTVHDVEILILDLLERRGAVVVQDQLIEGGDAVPRRRVVGYHFLILYLAYDAP